MTATTLEMGAQSLSTQRRSYVEFSANRVGQSRREYLNGRRFLVVPITSIIPGVLNGSQGPLYYAPRPIQDSVPLWDNVPIVRYHPLKAGKHVSAWDLEPHERIGFLRNSKYSGKLVHEGWFDEELTKNLDERIFNALTSGSPMEMSTGLYTENRPAENGANHGGKAYMHYAENYQPDHLAILPDQTGACSVRDGCGMNVNAKDSQGHGSSKKLTDLSARAESSSANANEYGGSMSHSAAEDAHGKAAQEYLKKGMQKEHDYHANKAYEHRIKRTTEKPLAEIIGKQTANTWSDTAREASARARRASTSAQATGKPEHHELAVTAHENAAWQHELEGDKFQAMHHRKQADAHERKTRGAKVLAGNQEQSMSLLERFMSWFTANTGSTETLVENTWSDGARKAATEARGHSQAAHSASWQASRGDMSHLTGTSGRMAGDAHRESSDAYSSSEKASKGGEENDKNAAISHHSMAMYQHKTAAAHHTDAAKHSGFSTEEKGQHREAAKLHEKASGAHRKVTDALVGNAKSSALKEKDACAEAEWVGKEHGTDGRGLVDVKPVEDSEIGDDIEMDEHQTVERPALSETHGITGNVWSDAAREAAAAAKKSSGVAAAKSKTMGVRSGGDVHEAGKKGASAETGQEHSDAALQHKTAGAVHWLMASHSSSQGSKARHLHAEKLHNDAADAHAKAAGLKRTNNEEYQTDQGSQATHNQESLMANRQQRLAALTANCDCDKSKAALNTLSDEMLDMLVENKAKIKSLTVNSAGALTIVKNTPSAMGSGSDSVQAGGEEGTYSKEVDEIAGDATEVGDKQVKGKKGPDAAAGLASKGKPVGNAEPAWLKDAPREDQEAWRQMKSFSRNKRRSLIQRLVGNIKDDNQRKAVAGTFNKLSTPELEQIVANQVSREEPARVENADDPEPVFLGNSSFDDYGNYQRESVVNGAVEVEGVWSPSLFEATK